MVEEFFNCSLLGIVPILEAMDDWRAVDTLLEMFGDDDKIRLHLKKFYTRKKIRYYTNRQVKSEKWYLGDKLHRDDGNPTLIEYYENGSIKTEEWLINGRFHRIGAPAIIDYYETGNVQLKYWCENGKRHRIGAPAFIYYSEHGSIITHERWFENGILIE